ncbi:MAG: hypothetical protein M1399_01185 [Actinobacteria bacterium]|nr:hypothetical protein [Actinomycetota bacterium]MCL5446785.1 hypothetical protein [Actinomycetota bacterium]
MVIRDTEIASQAVRNDETRAIREAPAGSVATLTREDVSDSAAMEGGPIEIPPTPAAKTALLTAVTVLVTLIELGISVAIVAAIAYALQTLVR